MRKFIFSSPFHTLLLLANLLFQAEIVFCQSTVEFFEENGQQGLKDTEGEVLIPAHYEELGWSKGINLPIDKVIGYRNKQAWGLISVRSKMITAPRYYSLEAFHKNLIVASIKGKFSNELFYGVINSKGEVVIDFRYHSLTPVHNLFIVSERKNGESFFGLLSVQKGMLLPTTFTNISYFKDDLFIFTAKDGQRGIINKNGIIQIDATLDSIAPATDNYSLIFKSGKIGAIDSAGSIIHQPLFKKIISTDSVEKFNHYQLYNAHHDLIKDFYCDSIYELSADLIIVTCNDFYEVLNNNFEVVYRGMALDKCMAFRKNLIFKKEAYYYLVKHSGESVEKNGFKNIMFDENYLYARASKQWKIFNKFGSSISNERIDSIIAGSNNLIPIHKNGYWGYIDHSGGMAIPTKFDWVSVFIGNMAEVNYLGSKRIINQFGEFVGASEYDQVTIGKSNTALVTKYGRTDLINHRGEVLFQTFNQLTPHFFGYLESTEEGMVGLISHLGEVILRPNYDYISSPMARRYVSVHQGGQKGLANFKGFWILPLSEEHEAICHISDGLIGIKRNGQYGFVDFGRKLLIANRYEMTKPFTQGMAAVKLNNKWGFIDKKEKLVVQPTYTEVTPFKNGLSIVQRNGLFGAIDLSNTDKIKIEFDTISTTTHDFLLAQKGGKYGLFNEQGNLLLQPSYEYIRPTQDDHFIVQRRGLSGLIDSSGSYSIPLKYHKIIEMSGGRYLCLKTKNKAVN